MGGLAIQPDVIAALIECYGARPSIASGRRLRFSLANCTAEIEAEADVAAKTSVQVELLDVGFGGAGFVSGGDFEIGQRVCLKLVVPGFGRQSWQCKIMNVVPSSEGKFRCGAQFIPSKNIEGATQLHDASKSVNGTTGDTP